MIPVGANIISASLDLTNYIMYGIPFSGKLGAFGVFQSRYSTLSRQDYAIAFTSDALFRSYVKLDQPYSSAH